MNGRLTRYLAWGGSIVAITLLGYFLFPGHTYLQSDTQIYVPMMERMRDPALFTRDIMVLRPHLRYTAYDEATVALSRVMGLERALTLEQLITRALGVTGLMLIALRLGLRPVEAWFVAAVVSLGATITGPAVLTVEYEPSPRGFAVSLVLLAVGLAAHERYWGAGVAAAIAFLYHPPTTAPFWIVAGVLAIRKRASWKMFPPLVAAGGLLMLLAHFQPPGLESAPVFQHLDGFSERVQRLRASYSYVSTWRAAWLWDSAREALVVALAAWRLRRVGGFLSGLPVIGLLSIPVSWILLEWQRWSLIPQWQPARAVLFLTLTAAILAAVAGMRAAHWAERIAWLTVAFLIPVKHVMVGRPLNPKLLALSFGLALVAGLASRIGRPALVVAGLIPFLAFPASNLVENYPRGATPELLQLSDWARANTRVDAVFLFPDARTDLDPGIFRARALRALYVDWKSGGQVNYFPYFSHEWWKRWVETGSGRWSVSATDFPNLAKLGIDHVVLRAAHTIPGVSPEFSNGRYAVYATSSRDPSRSDSRNNWSPWRHSAPSRSRPLSVAGPSD